MNKIKETNMNTRKIPQKIIFCISGAALLFLTAFPQNLWASGDDRVVLNKFLSGLEVVLVDLLQGSYQNSSNGQYYFEKGRHASQRPVLNTYYGDYRQPAFRRDCREQKYIRHQWREQHRPRQNNQNQNRYRQQYYDDYSWR